MKKILLLLAFYLLASKCFAQNEFARPTMDSLKRLLSVTKDPKDSLLLLQKMVDITPIREGEVANYSDRVTALLALNKRLKLIDPAPYQLTGDGNTQWRAKQYVEALKSLQAAIELFDKQHKQILPLLMNMRILYNLIGNQ